MSHVDLSSLRMGAPAAAMPRRPIGPRVLTGLAEDDHPQYMTSARVDSYLAGATLDATNLSGLVPNASISPRGFACGHAKSAVK